MLRFDAIGTGEEERESRNVAERPLEAAGVVVELLPSALYRVEIEGGHLVVAHVTGSPQRNFVRLIVGDRVVVELAPHDRGRGRIVRKL